MSRRRYSRKSKYRWTTIEGRGTYGAHRGVSRRSGIPTRPIAIALAVLVAAGLLFGLYKLLETPINNVLGFSTPVPTVSPTPDIPPATPSPTPAPTPTPRPGQDEDNALDYSGGAYRVRFEKPEDMKQLNIPYLKGDELLFSAGIGSITNEMVLKTLYCYNMDTGALTTIASSATKNSEIYETLLNERWFVWLDTDQQGSHRIYYIDRTAEGEGAEPRQIKECKNALPKLRLHGNILIWTEQTEDKQDKIYEVDLETGEDLSVATLMDEATYGVGAPAVFGTQVMWSGPDTDYVGENDLDVRSLIYIAHLDQAVQPPDIEDSTLTDDAVTAILENMDPFVTEAHQAGMYVHEPILNADAWAWVNANKDPYQTLYLRYNGSDRAVATGVTAYAFSDDFIVYAHSETIWAYFYKTGEYARLSPEYEIAYAPTVSGRRVAWIGSPDGSTDTYWAVVIPGGDEPGGDDTIADPDSAAPATAEPTAEPTADTPAATEPAAAAPAPTAGDPGEDA